MNKQFFSPRNISLRYRDYSLRTKLVSAFLIVTLIPIGVQFFQNNIAARQLLTNDANTALSSSAAQTAAVLDTFIAQGLSNVSTAAQSYIWEQYLTLSPAERTGSESEQVLYIDLRAQALRDQTYIDAVGLIDQNGIDIADTASAEIGSDKSTHRYISEPLRTGKAYSTVQFSPTTKKLSVYFSAPVRDSNGVIIGILRIRYNAEVLQQILTQSASKVTLKQAELILLDENHIRLAVSDSPELILKSIVPLPADKLAQLQAEHRLLADQTTEALSTNLPEFEEGLNNITSQPIFIAETKPEEYEVEGDTTGEQIAVAHMNTLPWLVAAAQQRSIYLAPLTAETREDIGSTLFIIVLIVFAAVFVARTISRPVVNLTRLAKQITAGDLSAQAQVESNDEIGQLAVAFNQMTEQLRNSLQDLDRRASELATVSAVGIAVSTILETDRLLQQVVDLTKERFNLYHSHIYLLDEAGQNLALASGAGEPGRQMMAKGLTIPINREQSLVARAARERKGVIVNDVTQAPDFLPNPLLPDTRSELAVPMIVGGKVIGVFDVQSDQVGRFTDVDINIQTTLASQLATSIQNVRSFEKAKVQAEMESLVNIIGQKIQKTVNVEDTLQTAIREIGMALGATRVSVNIGTNKQDHVNTASHN